MMYYSNAIQPNNTFFSAPCEPLWVLAKVTLRRSRVCMFAVEIKVAQMEKSN